MHKHQVVTSIIGLSLVALVFSVISYTTSITSDSQTAQVSSARGLTVAERAKSESENFRSLVKSGVTGTALRDAALIRRATLRSLMQTDPQAVLDAALSETELEQLPDNVQQYMEAHVTVEGDYYVGAIDYEDSGEEFYELRASRNAVYRLRLPNDRTPPPTERLTVIGVQVESDIAVVSAYSAEPQYYSEDANGAPIPSSPSVGELDPDTIPWYAFEDLKPDNYIENYERYRWNQHEPLGSPVTVHYHFPEIAPTYLSDAEQAAFVPLTASYRNAAREVFDDLETFTRMTFVEVDNLTESHMALMSINEFGSYAWYPNHGLHANDFRGDVGIARKVMMEQFPVPIKGEYSYDVLNHEIGHAIGMGHLNSEPYAEYNKRFSPMSYGRTSRPGSRLPYTYMINDFAYLQHLYGANEVTTAEDDVYSPSDEDVMMSIWDAGGFDTLSAVNAPRDDAHINLTPGQFSSLSVQPSGMWNDPVQQEIYYYWYTEDVGIGYGTCIERAVGGGGDDVIEGNRYNAASGCPGPDLLTGGAGADIFRFYPSWGGDVIEDFEDGIDSIDLRMLGISVTDMTKTQEGNDTILEYNGNTIRIKNISVSDVTDADADIAGDYGAPISPYGLIGGGLSQIIDQSNITDAGIVPVVVSANDNDLIERVEVKIDGSPLVTLSIPPYRYGWEVSSSDNGSRNLTADLYDYSGNVTTISQAVLIGVPDANDTTPPIISNIEAVDITDVFARIQFTLNEIVISGQFEIGTSTSYGAHYYDNYNFGTSYEANLNNLLPDTTYHYRVTAIDPSGNTTVSGDHTFTTLSDPPPTSDTTPPTVDITAPTNGSTLSDTISIQVSASDEEGVSRVEFYQDAILLKTDNTAPYGATWDTTTVSDGEYTLSATAYDDAENSNSDSITVTVENVVIPPTPDTTPPTITDIQSTDQSISESTDWQIAWSTDEPATSELWYGTHKRRINSVTGDSALVLGHSITLSNLQAGKTYHYYVISVDGAGNETQSNTSTFTTASSDPGGGGGGTKCTPGAKKKGEC